MGRESPLNIATRGLAANPRNGEEAVSHKRAGTTSAGGTVNQPVSSLSRAPPEGGTRFTHMPDFPTQPTTTSGDHLMEPLMPFLDDGQTVDDLLSTLMNSPQVNVRALGPSKQAVDDRRRLVTALMDSPGVRKRELDIGGAGISSLKSSRYCPDNRPPQPLERKRVPDLSVCMANQEVTLQEQIMPTRGNVEDHHPLLSAIMENDLYSVDPRTRTMPITPEFSSRGGAAASLRSQNPDHLNVHALSHSTPSPATGSCGKDLSASIFGKKHIVPSYKKASRLRI
uniref:Uncharacterized protein n=1 Tax=Octactis speculum TaxID=3111310 RepID=A0A7S2CFQ4_9STRA